MSFKGFPGGPDRDEDLSAFSLRIPDVAATSKIVLKRAGETLAERVVSTSSPQVTVTGPTGGQVFAHGDTVNVTWQSSDLDGDELAHVILISEDGGQNWIPLAANFPGNQFNFTATEDLDSVTFVAKVIVTDGINTSHDVSDEPFAIHDPTK